MSDSDSRRWWWVQTSMGAHVPRGRTGPRPASAGARRRRIRPACRGRCIEGDERAAARARDREHRGIAGDGRGLRRGGSQHALAPRGAQGGAVVVLPGVKTTATDVPASRGRSRRATRRRSRAHPGRSAMSPVKAIVSSGPAASADRTARSGPPGGRGAARRRRRRTSPGRFPAAGTGRPRAARRTGRIRAGSASTSPTAAAADEAAQGVDGEHGRHHAQQDDAHHGQLRAWWIAGKTSGAPMPPAPTRPERGGAAHRDLEVVERERGEDRGQLRDARGRRAPARSSRRRRAHRLEGVVHRLDLLGVELAEHADLVHADGERAGEESGPTTLTKMMA